MSEEDFWSSDEGILIRLEDLSHDFTFKTYNNALRGSFKDSGIKRLVWVTVLDNDTCKECEGMEGNDYSTGGFLPKMPRHPNCRCMWDVFVQM